MFVIRYVPALIGIWAVQDRPTFLVSNPVDLVGRAND
jgi:hypothetical protein